MQYQTVFDLSEVTLQDVESVTEQFRNYGAPTVNLADAKLTVIFEVDENGIAADLWDLRDICEEIEANLTSYMHSSECHIAKPTICTQT